MPLIYYILNINSIPGRQLTNNNTRIFIFANNCSLKELFVTQSPTSPAPSKRWLKPDGPQIWVINSYYQHENIQIEKKIS